jgi:pimeloyl-ACP methyl ester carboxylesterase
LPNFVAGERFGFGAALPTLTISFLGLAFSCEAVADAVLFGPTFHHEADPRAGQFVVSGGTTVAGVQLEMIERGRGRPILWLHGEEGLDPEAPVLGALARYGRVLAPSHPGYGHSPESPDIDTVDDLAYLHLDLLAQQDARDAVVIGASLGGWIAAEMAVRSTDRIGRLVLVAPLGIKVGGRETRDIPDIFALHPDEVLKLQYFDPTRARLDPATLSDDRLTVIARNREATALYAWEPYFHNPKLRGRLHRIMVPTLVLWGTEDRFVAAGYYGVAYRDAIPGARLETVPAAGHFPHLEQPAAVAERIGAFITT